MIKREHYLNEIRGFYHSDLIKVIKGVKGSGKTTLLSQIIDEIKLISSNIIYLDLDNQEVLDKIKNDLDLINYVEKTRKEGKCYIFLDEIGNLNGWISACQTLLLGNNSLFITSSFKNIISADINSNLTGRYVSFTLRPFIYQEIVDYGQEINKDIKITDYLLYGGLPKRLLFDDVTSQLSYIQNLLDEITNALIGKYQIRKIDLFKSITNYVFSLNGTIFSSNAIKNELKKIGKNCSINTIIKYLNYLQDGFLIEEVKQYSSKFHHDLKYFSKIYVGDIFFYSLQRVDQHLDLNVNLQNIVHHELITRGYDLSFYNYQGRKIDFCAKKGNKIYYIQVAYSVVDETNYYHKINAFKHLDPFSQKILITNDELDYSTSVIKHLKLKDFLLMEEL